MCRRRRCTCRRRRSSCPALRRRARPAPCSPAGRRRPCQRGRPVRACRSGRARSSRSRGRTPCRQPGTCLRAGGARGDGPGGGLEPGLELGLAQRAGVPAAARGGAAGCLHAHAPTAPAPGARSRGPAAVRRPAADKAAPVGVVPADLSRIGAAVLAGRAGLEVRQAPARDAAGWAAVRHGLSSCRQAAPCARSGPRVARRPAGQAAADRSHVPVPAPASLHCHAGTPLAHSAPPWRQRGTLTAFCSGTPCHPCSGSCRRPGSSRAAGRTPPCLACSCVGQAVQPGQNSKGAVPPADSVARSARSPQLAAARLAALTGAGTCCRRRS